MTSCRGGFFAGRPWIAISEVFSYLPGRRVGVCARTVSENVAAETAASTRPKHMRWIIRERARPVFICPPCESRWLTLSPQSPRLPLTVVPAQVVPQPGEQHVAVISDMDRTPPVLSEY